MSNFNSKVIYEMITTIERQKKAKGAFFSAINTKKDGSKRVWNCRLGVTKDLRGGQLPYDVSARNFITVWDRKAKMYRQLNVNTLEYLKVCGIVLVENGKKTKEYLKREKFVTVDHS